MVVSSSGAFDRNRQRKHTVDRVESVASINTAFAVDSFLQHRHIRSAYMRSRLRLGVSVDVAGVLCVRVNDQTPRGPCGP
jgi:hypothetical protein